MVALAVVASVWWGAWSGAAVARAPTKQDPAVVRMAMAEFATIQAKRGALVIDVRSPESFSAGHIPGAINIPLDDIATRARDIVSRAGGRPIVTYCSCVNEHTSGLAAQALSAAGVKGVSALVGGFPAWVKQGGVIERELVLARVS